jgi:hypothetical protein
MRDTPRRRLMTSDSARFERGLRDCRHRTPRCRQVHRDQASFESMGRVKSGDHSVTSRPSQ